MDIALENKIASFKKGSLITAIPLMTILFCDQVSVSEIKTSSSEPDLSSMYDDSS